jgi:DNA-binding GntR family transcriptional regulator
MAAKAKLKTAPPPTPNAKAAPAMPAPAGGAAPSRLQTELAARILRLLKDQGAGPGHHLVEQELCQAFGVSRTPVRGALKLLAEQGSVEARPNRGYVLVEPVTVAPVVEPLNPQEEADQQLLVAIAEARNTGNLPTEITQQELCRQFDAKPPTVVRVLRRLSELGLVERKAGNGWSFNPLLHSLRAQAESYKFRRAVEPAVVLQDTFELDREWAKETRARHMAFRRRSFRDFRPVEFYEMNSDFHETLAKCSGNRYLLDAVRRQIQLRSFLNYYWHYGPARVLASIDEHMAILTALEAGDNQLAANTMIEHLKASSRHTTEGPDGMPDGG